MRVVSVWLDAPTPRFQRVFTVAPSNCLAGCNGYLERPRAQLQYYERSSSKTIAYGFGNKNGSLFQLSPASWGEKNRGIGRMTISIRAITLPSPAFLAGPLFFHPNWLQ
jgi:hypothetical protein